MVAGPHLLQELFPIGQLSPQLFQLHLELHILGRGKAMDAGATCRKREDRCFSRSSPQARCSTSFMA
jgi:hypothetical protein